MTLWSYLLLLPLMMEVQTTNANWHAWRPHGSNQSLCACIYCFQHCHSTSCPLISRHLWVNLTTCPDHISPLKLKDIQHYILYNDNEAYFRVLRFLTIFSRQVSTYYPKILNWMWYFHPLFLNVILIFSLLTVI